MPYLIDGHNLIPKLGLSLRSVDDELQLVALLQEFCRLRRKQAEVYFDGAPPGQSGARKFGAVTAHFVRQGQSADAAIQFRLDRLGRAAKNWMVVSSDRAVQAAARAAHAGCLSSDEFASQVTEALRVRPSAPDGEAALNPQEVEEWLQLFRKAQSG